MRICFIGDSFVNGTNDPLCLGWAGRVTAQARQAGAELTLYNLGIRRDTSADIAARWRAEASARLPAGQPGLLVFSFGVNDCCPDDTGAPRLRFHDSLKTARAMLAEAATLWPTVMVGPPPIADDAVNGRIAVLSAALAQLCAELHIPFLPIYEKLLESEAWRHETACGDGAHPAAGGYDALADLVANWPAWRKAIAPWAFSGPPAG
jgi:lysophospholipase L1-like esterase